MKRNKKLSPFKIEKKDKKLSEEKEEEKDKLDTIKSQGDEEDSDNRSLGLIPIKTK